MKRFRGKTQAAVKRQIEWEYNALRAADLIPFWFAKGSPNPIVLFELGVHSARAQIKTNETGMFMTYPADIIVGHDPEYERKNDVRIQMGLSNPKIHVHGNFKDYLEAVKDWIRTHAERK